MKFKVPGKPKAWKRVARGKFGQVFDPNRKDKEYIGALALMAKSRDRSDMSQGQLMACMTFYVSDKVRRDLDNMVKLVWDALNKVIYSDDSQIVRLLAAKEQCSAGEEHTDIEIFPVKS